MAPLASGAPGAFIAKTLGLNSAQKKQVKAITESEIAAKAPKLSVLSAQTATNAANATNATNATNAIHAASATSAESATSATNASHAASATSSESAGVATNAEQLGGIPASGYLQGTITEVGAVVNVPKEGATTRIVLCPSGYQAVSGGVETQEFSVDVIDSAPVYEQTHLPIDESEGQHGAADGWQGGVHNTSTSTAYKMVVVAICSLG
jgi:hypothetical protein